MLLTKKGLRQEYFMPCMILSVAIIFLIYSALRCNPDSDAYFLIENGRWIFTHRAVPTVNPWCVAEGQHIVIQQWLCSLLNYLFSDAFGIDRLYLLAIAEHLVLVYLLYRWVGLFSANTYRLMLVVACCSMVLSSAYASTRPYQLTICLSLCALSSLVTYKRSRSGRADYLKLLAKLFLIALIQANYQISFEGLHLIWPLCFFAPNPFELITYMRNKQVRKCISLLQELVLLPGVWLMVFVGGLINPYGLEGVLYLFRSRNAISLTSPFIKELISPSVLSLTQLIFVLILVSFAYFFLWRADFHTVEPFLVYLSVGTVILAFLNFRNLWFMVPAVSALYALFPCSEPDKNPRYSRLMALFVLLVTVLGVLMVCGFDYGVEKDKRAHLEAFPIIRNLAEEGEKLGKEYHIYTEFNTGAFVQYAAEGSHFVKTYIDARPELYYPDITRDKDLLTEWLSLYGGIGIDTFLSESGYDFEFFEVVRGSAVEMYLRYHGGSYRLIDETGYFCLYEKCEN